MYVKYAELFLAFPALRPAICRFDEGNQVDGGQEPLLGRVQGTYWKVANIEFHTSEPNSNNRPPWSASKTTDTTGRGVKRPSITIIYARDSGARWVQGESLPCGRTTWPATYLVSPLTCAENRVVTVRHLWEHFLGECCTRILKVSSRVWIQHNISMRRQHKEEFASDELVQYTTLGVLPLQILIPFLSGGSEEVPSRSVASSSPPWGPSSHEG